MTKTFDVKHEFLPHFNVIHMAHSVLIVLCLYLLYKTAKDLST